jgi:hypothetical protein
MLAIFVACLAGLLVASWAGWEELGYAVFFMASSLTVYYVRPGSLLPVVVSAPLLPDRVGRHAIAGATVHAGRRRLVDAGGHGRDSRDRAAARIARGSPRALAGPAPVT